MLHLLPVDDRSILEFTKVHGIKDKKYLMNHLRGKQDESYGWQLLAKVKWLKHSSGVVIPVIGKVAHTFDARAAVHRAAAHSSAHASKFSFLKKIPGGPNINTFW